MKFEDSFSPKKVCTNAIHSNISALLSFLLIGNWLNFENSG